MTRHIGIEELLAHDARSLARYALALSWQVDCVQESPWTDGPVSVDELLRFTIEDNGNRHAIWVDALAVDNTGTAAELEWQHRVNTASGGRLSTRRLTDLDELRRRLLRHGCIDLRGVA